MRRSIIILSMLSVFTIFYSCEEDSFTDNPSIEDIEAPKNLKYQEIINTREFALIRSGVPTIDTGGLIPFFEIISGRTEDGTLLDASFMDDISIQNPVSFTQNLSEENFIIKENGDTIKTISGFEIKNNGIITINDENKFGLGTYYFTIKVTTSSGAKELSTTFTDVLKLSVGPELVTNLLYLPLAQNLVVGTDAKTTKPLIVTGNANVSFELLTETDKLSIDTQTGILSLKPDYAPVENDTIFPKVEVISDISGERTTFEGEGFFSIVISNTPVTLDKQTRYFFYPTFVATDEIPGYKLDIIKQGTIPTEDIWKETGASPLADQETFLPTIENKAIFTNGVVGGVSDPHESDVILNTQNLSEYKIGFDLGAVFYIQNRFVEYLSDGRTPSDLEVYISTDYIGDNNAATWTKVNEILSCQINSVDGTPFIGTPYPGDQKLDDPDGRKDPTRNADGKWVRCELDLNPYKLEKRFTMKFKFASYFVGSISNGAGTGRAGRYLISDVYYKATEQ